MPDSKSPDFFRYLELMVEKDGSDAYFTVDSPVRIKVNGTLMVAGKHTLTPELTQACVKQFMNKQQLQDFLKQKELDFALRLPNDAARFRVNAFFQQGYISLVARYVKSQIPSLEQLRLPPILKELVMRKQGVLLMAGPTGSGKSTTLAAMLDYRNSHHAGHILTIEDPIEFVHKHKKSVINQRSLGDDTDSFEHAMRSAVREAPDVIQIGEVRDKETLKTMLEMSGTGHLVLSTLHARNSYQAMQRIVTMFPPEYHAQLFSDLSMDLTAILSQRLAQTVDGKRTAVLEIMLNTPYIKELIRHGNIADIKEAMQSSGNDGMLTFDNHLISLYQDGIITFEEALANADSRTDLETRLKFG